MRLALPIVLTLALLAAALPAVGRSSARPAPAEPWATVNVCDTTTHPNQIGIRGSMPGLARRTRMYMRFRVQFRDMEGKWRMVKSEGDYSRWRKVAVAGRGDYDAGWTIEFEPPASGGAHVLRGVVSFQWRRGARVVQRDRAYTESGHPGTVGADPSDFSSDICEIA
jgi:hypothetical protein